MRKANIIFGGILILELILIPSCSAFAGPTCIAWEFNADGDSEGWQIGQSVTLEVLDGKLTGNITQPGGYWVGPDNLNIDASVYKSLEIKYRVDSLEASDVAYFYWIKTDDPQFGNNKRVKFDIQTNNTWQDMSVDLSQSVNWNSVITGVRLAPVLFSDFNTAVDYDYIRLCK